MFSPASPKTNFSSLASFTLPVPLADKFKSTFEVPITAVPEVGKPDTWSIGITLVKPLLLNLY